MSKLKIKLAVVAAMVAMLLAVTGPAFANTFFGGGDDEDYWGWHPYALFGHDDGYYDLDDYPYAYYDDEDYDPFYYEGYPVVYDIDYENEEDYAGDWDCYLEERDWDNDGYWELEYVCYPG